MLAGHKTVQGNEGSGMRVHSALESLHFRVHILPTVVKAVAQGHQKKPGPCDGCLELSVKESELPVCKSL